MRLPLAALLAAFATGAFAQSSFIFSGDTTNKPTFRRPDGLSSFDPGGRMTRYEATAFTVSATGTYVGELTAAFDPYLLVYQDAFDPASPLTNLVNGDRTSIATFTVLSGQGMGQGNDARAARIFAGEANDSNNETFLRNTGLPLQAGRKYFAVATAFRDPTEFAVTVFGFPAQGAYRIGIGGGPGNVTPFAPVPEPASLAALGLGAAALLRRRSRRSV